MPPAVRILYPNHGLVATWTATSEETTTPARELANPIRGRVWRSTGLGSPERIVADLGSAKALEGAAIISSNLTPAATITIKVNSADSWAGLPAGQVFTLTPWDATNTGVLLKLFGAVKTFRYLAIELTDLANPDGYYELGVAFAGGLFAPTKRPAAFQWWLTDPSMLSYAPSQTPHTEERVKFAEAEMAWINLDAADVYGDFQTALRAFGTSKDVLLSIFSAAPGFDDVSASLNLYGRFGPLPRFMAQIPDDGDHYDWGPVSFRESK